MTGNTERSRGAGSDQAIIDQWAPRIWLALIAIVLLALAGHAYAGVDWAECRKQHSASYCRSAEQACEQPSPGSYRKWCPS